MPSSLSSLGGYHHLNKPSSTVFSIWDSWNNHKVRNPLPRLYAYLPLSSATKETLQFWRSNEKQNPKSKKNPCRTYYVEMEMFKFSYRLCFSSNISHRSGRAWGPQSAWKTSRNLFKGIDRVSWRAQKVWRDHPGSHNLSGTFLFFIALRFSEKNRANKYVYIYINTYSYITYVSIYLNIYI